MKQKDQSIEQLESKLTTTKILLILLLTVFTLFILNKNALYSSQKKQEWLNEAWIELQANNYETIEKDGFRIKYIKELDDMKILEFK